MHEGCARGERSHAGRGVDDPGVFGKGQAGFSLIEVAIAAAIVSVLAAIAIPNFAAHRARAIRSEVKSNISTIARMQSVYLSDHGTYTDNLQALGWSPTGSPRFIMGFTTDAVPTGSGTNDTAEIDGDFSRAEMVGVFDTPLTQSDLPPSPVTSKTFVVGAAGNIDNDPILDQWTLDHNNVLTCVTDDL